LLIAGLLLAPAIVLQQNIIVKALQSALFLVLAVASVPTGKRRLVIGSVVFMITTVTVNLFSPAGRVILQIGPVRITQGALRLGISKATTVASLLFLSRSFVRSSVRFPGVLGRYIAQTFAYLGRLTARRERITRRNVVRRLDELFGSILNSSDEEYGSRISRAGNTTIGVLALILLLIVNWGALFLPFSALLAEL
jgi:hypothetical protein